METPGQLSKLWPLLYYQSCRHPCYFTSPSTRLFWELTNTRDKSCLTSWTYISCFSRTVHDNSLKLALTTNPHHLTPPTPPPRPQSVVKGFFYNKTITLSLTAFTCLLTLPHWIDVKMYIQIRNIFNSLGGVGLGLNKQPKHSVILPQTIYLCSHFTNLLPPGSVAVCTMRRASVG